MTFTMSQKVMFRHCDPAGIVFFPRYFEMVNDCVEQFFADVLDWPFETIHPNCAVPTARIECEFIAPSRHGDELEFEMDIKHIGRSSMRYCMVGRCARDRRLSITGIIVFVDAQGKPQSWPKSIRMAIKDNIKETM